MIGDLTVRDVRDEDADGLARLIGDVFAEYPGCVLDLGGVDRDLSAMDTHITGLGGRFWVAETIDGAVTACCGYVPIELDGEPAVELKRLYVTRDARGRGLGAWFVALVEGAARERGAVAIDLWSDTRFTPAHRLYERLGFTRLPETRELHDPSQSVEYHYRKPLR